MAVIRQKKRNLALAMLFGIVLCAIPFGIYSGVITYKKQTIQKELEECKKEANSEKSYTAYCLKEDKNKNDVIDVEDLQEVTLKSKKELQIPKRSDLEGKYLSVGVRAGIILTSSMVYEDEGFADDVRTYMYDYIVLPEGITSQNRFDIHIRFPNGEDYIVAKEKYLVSLTEGGAFIQTTQKEHLLLSSAYVDTTIYTGAVIYAALYLSDYQEAATPTYPFNLYTTELAKWDPNLIEEVATEQNSINRQILEANLFDFMGIVMGGETLVEN